MDLPMLILSIICSTILTGILLYVLFRKFVGSLGNLLGNFSSILPSELTKDPDRVKGGKRRQEIRRYKEHAKQMKTIKSTIVSNAGTLNPMIGVAVDVAKQLGLSDSQIFEAATDPDIQKLLLFAGQNLPKVGEAITEKLSNVGKGKKRSTQWA